MTRFPSYYKGYWMVTNRCNLRCSYCVLENAYHQLKQELDLNGKKELISHLYHQLNFRRLTLSGGEVLIIGKSPPNDFTSNSCATSAPSARQILLKTLRSSYTQNGTYLDENVANEMEGVVDVVAVTIDTTNDLLFTQTW